MDAANVGPGTTRMSATVATLAASLTKAQGEMKNPPKDSQNPHFKSKYADLATVRDAVVPVLSKHGLSVVQLPCELAGYPALTTLLLHTSGEWVETTFLLRPTKADPQGVGSALTYARRYALQSVAGVAAEDDDDGHAGSRPAERQQQRERRQDRPADPQPTADDIAAARKLIADAATIKQLGAAWNAMPPAVQRAVAADKDRRKAELTPTPPPPATATAPLTAEPVTDVARFKALCLELGKSPEQFIGEFRQLIDLPPTAAIPAPERLKPAALRRLLQQAEHDAANGIPAG